MLKTFLLIKRSHGHINRLNDVSESLEPNLEVDYLFKITKTSESDVKLFIDEGITPM